MDLDGTSLPLDDNILASITSTQEEFASRGQRVILLAKRVVHPVELENVEKTPVDSNVDEDRLMSLNVGLVIVGLVALVDPPRDDTAHTVKVCRRAGIRFVMVTGALAL